MASLDLLNSEIYRAALMEAGLGRDVTAIDSATEGDLRNIIRAGLRRFYFPIENGVPYRWRFLRKHASFSIVPVYETGTIAVTGGVVTLTGGVWPLYATSMFIRVNGHVLYITVRTSNSLVTVQNTELTVAAGTAFQAFRYRYALPSDFAEWDGGVVYAISEDNLTTGSSHFLAEADEADLRMRYSIGHNEDAETRHYAISTAPSADDYYILFWPVPEPDAFIQGIYHSIPADSLPLDLTNPGSDVTQVPHMYGDALMECVLAAAEAYNHSAVGIHEQRAQAALMSAMHHDRATAGEYDFSCMPNSRRYGEDGMGCGPPGVGTTIEFIQ